MERDIADFISAATTAYLATASADGQPYVQHRGGPAGFLHVLDEQTVAFADLRGNRQYISLGNLRENPRVLLFIMDYVHRQRVKIWGVAEVSEDPALMARLTPKGERSERVIVIRVTRCDVNCPKGIPQMLPAADVARALAVRDARIAELEAGLESKGRSSG
jgi:predicted pyridoxine 5'-phosphate oxidase superfamily flavin-nucleotide-binding protein